MKLSKSDHSPFCYASFGSTARVIIRKWTKLVMAPTNTHVRLYAKGHLVYISFTSVQRSDFCTVEWFHPPNLLKMILVDEISSRCKRWTVQQQKGFVGIPIAAKFCNKRSRRYWDFQTNPYLQLRAHWLGTVARTLKPIKTDPDSNRLWKDYFSVSANATDSV